ncbi:MAG: hypothetical protein SVX28_00890 [Pseudomonadota bacterium]|nr:hypothetical protein [Pseudomonadota bacterium]
MPRNINPENPTMDYLLLIVSLVLLAVCVFLYIRIKDQQAVIDELLEASSDPVPDVDPEMILTLRVKDPISLAKRQSQSARKLADRLPVMVTRMVYQEVRKELEKELREREIDTEINVEYR